MATRLGLGGLKITGTCTAPFGPRGGPGSPASLISSARPTPPACPLACRPGLGLPAGLSRYPSRIPVVPVRGGMYIPALPVAGPGGALARLPWIRDPSRGSDWHMPDLGWASISTFWFRVHVGYAHSVPVVNLQSLPCIVAIYTTINKARKPEGMPLPYS